MQFDYFSAIKFQNLSNQSSALNGLDAVALEVGLEISINDIPYTVTMRTPGDEKALIRGLLYTEKIVQTPSFTISVTGFDEAGNIIRTNVKTDPKNVLKPVQNTRNSPMVSSCGLCGKVQLSDVEECEEKILDDFCIDLSHIPKLFSTMSLSQKLFIKTGGTHAAALFQENYQKIAICEDIGRHNAVDKVIGKALIAKKLNQAKILVVSGRVSFEIIQKAARAQIPIICSVSAPTSLAVQRAEQYGIMVIGFCRKNKATIYSGFYRVEAE